MDTSSKLYRPDQMCVYHSNSVGHNTEDCINLKTQDSRSDKLRSGFSSKTTPNVNTNPLPNNGGVSIKMIEIDDWCMTKAITPIVHDKLKRDVESLSVKE